MVRSMHLFLFLSFALLSPLKRCAILQVMAYYYRLEDLRALVYPILDEALFKMGIESNIADSNNTDGDVKVKVSSIHSI